MEMWRLFEAISSELHNFKSPYQRISRFFHKTFFIIKIGLFLVTWCVIASFIAFLFIQICGYHVQMIPREKKTARRKLNFNATIIHVCTHTIQLILMKTTMI